MQKYIKAETDFSSPGIGKRRLSSWSLILALTLTFAACSANERPLSPARSLVPTFTATAAATPPSINLSVVVTPEVTLAPPPLVPSEEPLKDPNEIPDLFITTEPTITVPPTGTTSPTTTVQSIATIPAVVLTPGIAPNAAPTTPEIVMGGPILYTVQSGDTLLAIAARFQTTVDAIKAANDLVDDIIYAEQALTIPAGAPPMLATPVPQANRPVSVTQRTTPRSTLPAPVTSISETVRPLSILEGDLAKAYPTTFATDRLTLHYAPGTIPPDHPQLLADILTRALAHHEKMLQITLPGRFDAYVAGSPFVAPDQSLRGHSYSAQRYFVFLDDGSGNLADLTYLAAHELTHMFTWLVFGRPTDPMLSEGAAVYIGMDFIAGEQHMPITTFCAAYSQMGMLPRVSANLRYQGHIRDLENYYGAGCFVKYLIETYGPQKFGKLYPSNDYVGIYGKSLKQLDDDWHAALAAEQISVPFDAAELVRLVELLEAAHTKLFDSFTGTAKQMALYRQLDQVRMALLEGRLDDVKAYFAQ